MTTTADHPRATFVSAASVEELPWRQLPGFDHVEFKLLWQSGKSVAGVLRIAPYATLEEHVHQRSHHHIWVLEGVAEMLGQRAAPGTYLHVPAGVEHGMAAGPEGCTVFYLYLRDAGPAR